MGSDVHSVQCEFCNEEMCSLARACPHCGHPGPANTPHSEKLLRLGGLAILVGLVPLMLTIVGAGLRASVVAGQETGPSPLMGAFGMLLFGGFGLVALLRGQMPGDMHGFLSLVFIAFGCIGLLAAGAVLPLDQSLGMRIGASAGLSLYVPGVLWALAWLLQRRGQ